MKVIDLLNKIANGEIETGTIFYVNGDFFYDLVVINENLYVINTMLKQLELLENKYINRFIKDDVELLILKEENIEEEPRDIEVCGSFFTRSEYNKLAGIKEDKKIEKVNEDKFNDLHNNTKIILLKNKINEIIDYLDKEK